MILTLTKSRSSAAAPSGQKDYLILEAWLSICETECHLINTFAFLAFTRPLAIPSDVSAALVKKSFAFVSHFMLKKIKVS